MKAANPTFPLQSRKNGRIYRLSADEVQDFYDEHILGGAGRVKAAAIARFRELLRKIGRSEKGMFARLDEALVCSGTVLLRLFRDGELVDARAGSNLIVDTGKAAVIDRLQAASPAVHDFQAVGTGATAAAAGNTTLGTEIGTRVQGTLTQPTATTDRLVSVFAAGNGTGALTETGRLNAATVGNLFCRQVFSVVNKAAADTLTITHDITVS